MTNKQILIKAEQKFLRATPQKVRLVTQAIKLLPPKEALERLKFTNKRAAGLVAKVVKQAISNAVNNNKLKESELKFAKIEVLPGPIIKRFRPVSRGRAHSIFKRTCHLKVLLTIKENSKHEIRNPKQYINSNV